MVLILIVLIACGLFSIILFFESRIYPNTFIQNAPVGAMNTRDALSTVSDTYTENFTPITLSLAASRGDFDPITIDPTILTPTIEYQKAISNAFSYGKTQNVIFDTVSFFKAFTQKQELPLDVSFNEDRLTDIFTSIETQVNEEPIEPKVTIAGTEVTVTRGSAGYKLDRDQLRKDLVDAVLTKKTSVAVVTKHVDPTISESTAQNLTERATQLIGKVLIIESEDTKIRKSPQDMAALLAPHGYNDQALLTFAKEIADRINRPIESPVFSVVDGKVETFSPPKDGLKLDESVFINEVIKSLTSLANGEEKEATVIAPTIKDKAPEFSSSAKDYGIVELIGKGTSTFRGSIPSRVHNVALAASRIDGTLIAPGQTFSFNAAVGDISQLTGFKQAYVIQNGKTVLGDGGGVCQVSTTLFRAVLNAGLAVSERRSHSYRVGYYEQDAPVGMDATVYSPTTDFKFTNDTANHILVHTIPDTKNFRLTFELYGTKDGRVSEITKPVISNVIPPPEDLYVDDPTLPTGKVNQVEHKAVGSKATFNYTVTKNGQVTYKKTFVSVYQPWQAVFMRGTGPAQ